MSKKPSPHRRRSIAVLGHGQAKASSRRRAYSIAPGERLSPAAKARRLLVPRKSILKASLNLPPQHARQSEAAEPSTSGATDDGNMTQTMDFTQVHGQGPRKSLARRVSFAAHTHVRLFHKDTSDGNSKGGSPSPTSPEPSVAFVTRAENDENAIPGPSQPQRRYDMDDTAQFPQDFLNQNRPGAGPSGEEDEFTEDEDDAIALNIQRKRRNSLGSLQRRRSSIVTTNQHQSENMPPHDDQTIQEEEDSFQHDGEEEPTTSSAHTGSSFASEGSSGEPMEFTIPVLQSMREPREPDPIWLHEPYEPPPPESDDDAVMIQPPLGQSGYFPQNYTLSAEGENEDGEADMDLTSAMSRLQQARHTQQRGDDSFSEEELPREQALADDTFSTDDSFGNESADLDNRTINLTQRTSLGTLESSMDMTDVQDGNVRVPVTSVAPIQPSPPTVPIAAVVQPEPAQEPLGRSLMASLGSGVFSAPPPGGLGSSLFGSSVFSAPGPAPVFAPIPAPALEPEVQSDPPRTPSKSPGPATVPKPFNFSLPRASSPSKIPAPSANSHQPHRGTAAFAPPSVPKSHKRPAFDLPDTDGGSPSPAKRPAVGRLSAAHASSPDGDTTEATTQPAPGTNDSRRTSYFAQRKSLGASSAEGVRGGGLRTRASMGGQPSQTAPLVPLIRSHSDPSLNNRTEAAEGGSLYPDLTQLASDAHAQRSGSPVPVSTQGNAHNGNMAPDSTVFITAGDSPASVSQGIASSSQPTTMPPPAVPTRGRPVTHIEKPLGSQARIIDVSMTVDVEPEAQIAEGSVGVSQAWRDSVPDEPLQDDDGPTISIEQFFQMTGIRFMDELTMPKPRRSTVLPGQLRPRARRRSSSTTRDASNSMGPGAGGEDEEAIPLAEFAVALAVDMPRLDLYGAVARDLTAYIQECKKIYREAEEEAYKVTPSLFKEFAAVDEGEQAMLIHQLKLIKAHNMGTAKSQWYDWKLQWVEQLYESAAQGFINLESDATYLAGVIKDAQDILPALREEYAEVTRLLAQEQADIDEIENSDKDFLNELKATIAEQSTEIEAFRADVSEAKAKLERLDEKLAEIDLQKEEATAAISKAKHIIHIQKESTSVEVFRLKDELEALQDLHLWRAVTHTSVLVEFTYASKYHVSLSCTNFKPILAQAAITRTKQSKLKERDAFPRFTDLVMKTAASLVKQSDEKLDIKQVIERLGDFWSSCAQLRSQLAFLSIKYPLAVESLVDEDGQSFLRATATAMFPRVAGKAFISFLWDRNTYSRWPLSVQGLKTDVKRAYGAIEPEAISNAILGRLSQVTPADSHGCLLDACIEATELYEQT
ncbi:Spc7 kinetochore protein-domain-containing protein [Trametes gibbosa]|nr:Spc7 kinetochore protein-domain-containing protein [Trametes gibbosa]